MGGSYGGYLTTLLIGRTTRFAAAISERAFIDPVSFVGSSDIGWFFPDQYLGTDPERVAAQSAMAARRGDHHADAGHPLRGGLALPARAGRPALRRAQAPRRPVGAAAVPRRGPRAVPLRPAAAPAGPARARAALVGALAADGAEPGGGELPPARDAWTPASRSTPRR